MKVFATWVGVALLVLAAWSASLLVAQQGADSPAPTVVLSGDGIAAQDLTREVLAAVGAEPITWTHKGTTYRFTGVPLVKVVDKAGLGPGPKDDAVAKAEKRAGYKFVVVASAADGYQAVYSYAELAEPNASPTKVYLVWELDGAPLPDSMGPFRLVCTTDGEGARSVFHLTRLDTVDMRRLVPATEAP